MEKKFSIIGADGEIILKGTMDVEDAQHVVKVAVISAMAILENQQQNAIIPLMALNMIDDILMAIKEHISGEDAEYVQIHSKIN